MNVPIKQCPLVVGRGQCSCVRQCGVRAFRMWPSVDRDLGKHLEASLSKYKLSHNSITTSLRHEVHGLCLEVRALAQEDLVRI